MKSNGKRKHYKPKELLAEIALLKEHLENVTKLWQGELEGKSKAMSAMMEEPVRKQQMECVRAIAEGRHDDAIKIVLTRVPLIFGVDVRMDDSTYQKAKKDWYDAGYKAAITKLQCSPANGES